MITLSNILEVYKSSKTYSELVQKLIELNIISYTVHVGAEITIWRLKDHSTIIKNGNHHHLTIADHFTPNGIKDAIQLNREGKIDYHGFLKHIAQAGCQLYEATLMGDKRVEYIGKDGIHTEPIQL